VAWPKEDVPPLQGSIFYGIVTQGFALGWYVSPRWGWRLGEHVGGLGQGRAVLGEGVAVLDAGLDAAKCGFSL